MFIYYFFLNILFHIFSIYNLMSIVNLTRIPNDSSTEVFKFKSHDNSIHLIYLH